MTDLAGALCVGKWWLFDSTEPSDHAEARALCAQCPALMACVALAAEVRSPTSMAACGGGMSGTWAGRLYTTKGHRRAAGRPPLPREHGTDRGYHQHRQQDEEACSACRAAHVAVVEGRAVS